MLEADILNYIFSLPGFEVKIKFLKITFPLYAFNYLYPTIDVLASIVSTVTYLYMITITILNLRSIIVSYSLVFGIDYFNFYRALIGLSTGQQNLIKFHNSYRVWICSYIVAIRSIRIKKGVILELRSVFIVVNSSTHRSRSTI